MIIDSFNDLNWVAVAVATIAAFAIGLVWFAPPVLGTLWARQVSQYAGIAEADVTDGAAKGAALLPWFVATAVNVVVLALAVAATGADSLADGVVLGLVLSAGLRSDAVQLADDLRSASTDLVAAQLRRSAADERGGRSDPRRLAVRPRSVGFSP